MAASTGEDFKDSAISKDGGESPKESREHTRRFRDGEEETARGSGMVSTPEGGALEAGVGMYIVLSLYLSVFVTV